MNPWVERLLNRSVESLVRVACFAALAGLAVMAASILYPTPLLVIFAMSGGHVIGGFAVVCYVLSILMDVNRKYRATLAPPAPVAASEPADSARTGKGT
jgi:hypothetical protein